MMICINTFTFQVHVSTRTATTVHGALPRGLRAPRRVRMHPYALANHSCDRATLPSQHPQLRIQKLY